MRRTTTFIAGIAAALLLGAGSAAAAPTPFGSDLAASPNPALGQGQVTEVQNGGGTGALPAGYAVPANGVLTGWRLKHAAGAGTGRLVHFHVVRGNTSIYKASAVDIGTTDGVSATFPESVLVQQGDRIGLTNDSGVTARTYLAAMPGASLAFWNPPLGANETRAPSNAMLSNFAMLLQADLDTAASVCGGVQATIAGTAGNDVILGTVGNDVIVALGGDDIVRGLGGDDIICGGDGNDKLKGGAGKDTLYGDAGRDKLNGGGAKDRCFGGADKDAIGCEKAKQN